MHDDPRYSTFPGGGFPGRLVYRSFGNDEDMPITLTNAVAPLRKLHVVFHHEVVADLAIRTTVFRRMPPCYRKPVFEQVRLSWFVLVHSG